VPYYRCPACGLLSHSVAAYSTAGICANCSAPLPDDAKLQVVSESVPSVSRSIRAGLDAPAEARHAVSSLPLRESVRDRLALVVSELVTNSLRHAGLAAGDPIELELTAANGDMWVSVRDGGPGFEPSLRSRSRAANGGFGLSIIATLAREWGVDRGPAGFEVWCAVDTASAEPADTMRQPA
jgi:anti-sigma regulatory factor (Ser/Thr protein kinase)